MLTEIFCCCHMHCLQVFFHCLPAPLKWFFTVLYCSSLLLVTPLDNQPKRKLTMLQLHSNLATSLHHTLNLNFLQKKKNTNTNSIHYISNIMAALNHSHSVASWELEGISKGHHWSRLYNPPPGKHLHIYISPCLRFFSLLLRACLNVHVKKTTISLPTLTAQQDLLQSQLS